MEDTKKSRNLYLLLTMQPPALTPVQARVLNFIRENPGLTHEDIANRLVPFDVEELRRVCADAIEFLVFNLYAYRDATGSIREER